MAKVREESFFDFAGNPDEEARTSSGVLQAA